MAANNQQDKPKSIEDIWPVLLKIRDNTTHLTKEFDNLKRAFTVQEKDISSIKEANSKLTAENAKLKDKVDVLDGQVERLCKQMNEITLMQDTLEQYTRKNSLEVAGIPESSEVSCKQIMLRIAKELGVDMEETDIEITHRLKRKGETPPIIVKFLSHKKKTEIYRSRAKLRNVKMADVFPEMNLAERVSASKIFINENLTYRRRKMVGAAIRNKKCGDIVTFWTLDGKLFIKRGYSENPIMVSSMDELDDL
ncbi:hypothetical protein QZH41_000075 [Actinostola sp. cb2023]|nr:hypothetical protein QZH41_000075 [Actinostola sp. cb2023]